MRQVENSLNAAPKHKVSLMDVLKSCKLTPSKCLEMVGASVKSGNRNEIKCKQYHRTYHALLMCILRAARCHYLELGKVDRLALRTFNIDSGNRC